MQGYLRLMIYLRLYNLYNIFENIPSVPIILYKIEIQDNGNSDGKPYFSIEDFDEPVVIQPFPAAKSTLFRLKFNSCTYDEINGVKDMFKTYLHLLQKSTVLEADRNPRTGDPSGR